MLLVLALVTFLAFLAVDYRRKMRGVKPPPAAADLPGEGHNGSDVGILTPPAPEPPARDNAA